MTELKVTDLRVVTQDQYDKLSEILTEEQLSIYSVKFERYKEAELFSENLFGKPSIDYGKLAVTTDQMRKLVDILTEEQLKNIICIVPLTTYQLPKPIRSVSLANIRDWEEIGTNRYLYRANKPGLEQPPNYVIPLSFDSLWAARSFLEQMFGNY